MQPGRPLSWNWHIDVMCEYLQAFHRREIKRLLINIPPRCFKSTLVSVTYPSWVWVDAPWHQFLCVSNADSLALRDAVDMRRLVQSRWYQGYFGETVTIADDQGEKSYFKNSANGHRVSQGINATVTGKSGDTLLIDDPIDADRSVSDVENQNVLDAYDCGLTSRLNDQVNGGICIIMQRLRVNDLAGHVKQKTEAPFTVLEIPMEYDGPRYVSMFGPRFDDPRTEEGELLWPERFPIRVVRSLKEDLGGKAPGQLQQRPTAKGGNIFKREWFTYLREPPVFEKVIQSWDTASKKKERNDPSACVTLGKHKTGYVVLDVWRDKLEFPDLKRQVVSMYLKWQPDEVIIEDANSGTQLLQELQRETALPLKSITVDKDKERRADAVTPACEARRVQMIEGPWNADFITELCDFPNGPNDDRVDAFTQAMSRLIHFKGSGLAMAAA